MDRFVYKKEREHITIRREFFLLSILNSILGKTFLIVISFILIYNVFHSIRITLQKLEVLNQAEAEVNELRLRNMELETLLTSMQTDQFLEIEARDRLNFYGDKDIIFVIPENVLSSAKDSVDGILGKKIEVEEKTNIESWEEVLINGI